MMVHSALRHKADVSMLLETPNEPVVFAVMPDPEPDYV